MDNGEAFWILSRKISIDSDQISNCHVPCLHWAKNIYRKLYLSKKWGKNRKRKILIPCGKLKIIQKSILEYLEPLSERKLKDCAIAYRQWKSIKDAATPHIWAERLIKIDIQDFFPSITRERVERALWKIGIRSLGERRLISVLCTYRNELPQWAPTSPLIANISVLKLDDDVLRLISNYESADIKYTRYADDLIFSFHGPQNSNQIFEEFIEKIIKIVEKNWFAVNLWKIWSFWRWARQIVTGIVVNDKLSLGRGFYRQLRVEIHDFQGKKLENEPATLYELKNRLEWRLAFLNQINPDLASRLRNKYDTDNLFAFPSEISTPAWCG